jgi:glycosyltransferase involved in cell wall biosynthesis
VRYHIERLPGQVEVLYGRANKMEMSDGTPLIPSVWNSIARVAGMVGRSTVVRRRARTRAVSRLCKAREIGVALAEFGPTAAAISGDLERAGVPLVAHFHGYDAYDEDNLAEWLPRYRNMFARHTAVVAVSEHMRRQLLELGAPGDRTHVVRVGVDVDLFHGAEPAAAPPRFLVVGRFVEKKAPQLAVLAFGQVHAKDPEVRLTLVGDGPLLADCRRLVRTLGISGAVEIMPPQPNTVVAQLMRESRGLIHHSVRAVRGDSEGTPVVVMEAMASGLPVIGSRHTGIGEIIDHERTGLLSDERDIDTMAEHITRLAQEPDLAARLGSAAAIEARADHRLQDSIDRLAAVLEEVRVSGL